MPTLTPWPHFSAEELTCHCGCGRQEMDHDFMTALEALRVEFGKSMPITSGFRCPNHNMQASKTGATGPHTTGKAVDIQISGADAHRLLGLAIQRGFTGIGVSQDGFANTRFIHLDMCGQGYPRPALWSY
ncbi:MAG: DUF882 domain-containing protein [Magnetococcales bacterium]|nr:DUF882 domain-containing protein [Magnetococcales bacterium]